MPTSLVFSCYRYPSKSRCLTINIDTNDTNRSVAEDEQLWEMVRLRFIWMMGIIDAEASSAFE